MRGQKYIDKSGNFNYSTHMQIDPKNITNFSRTDAELQAFALFAIFCAGKNSDYASKCLARLLHKCDSTPFEYLRGLGETGIHNALVASKIGQYTRLTKAVMGLLNLDLATCSLDDLMAVHGCGPKTARFFLLHSRPNIECAVLDVNILKYLRETFEGAPSSTPTRMTDYAKWEYRFLQIAKNDFPHMSIADIDLILWMRYSRRLDNDFVSPDTPNSDV